MIYNLFMWLSCHELWFIKLQCQQQSHFFFFYRFKMIIKQFWIIIKYDFVPNNSNIIYFFTCDVWELRITIPMTITIFFSKALKNITKELKLGYYEVKFHSLFFWWYLIYWVDKPRLIRKYVNWIHR